VQEILLRTALFW